jgi:SAM-dependent methyltransferase
VVLDLPETVAVTPFRPRRGFPVAGPAAAQNLINTPERLRQRTACNLSASADFDRFVIGLLAPSADDVALDLGPGLGRQMVPLAGVISRLVGVECSSEMAAAVRAQISGPSVELIVGSMDDLASLDLAGPFTLVYAVYSLHHASDPARVVEAVRRLLEGPEARFVVVTPDVGNNAGWFSDLGQLYSVPTDALAVPGIGRRVILPAFRGAFRKVACSRFSSTVSFPTIEALMRYYDACAPYCRQDRRAEALAHFRAKVERDGGYRIVKRSLGLVGRP